MINTDECNNNTMTMTTNTMNKMKNTTSKIDMLNLDATITYGAETNYSKR